MSDYDAIYSQDHGGRNPDYPHGWIQWKGTDVCINLSCECGLRSHYDGDFLYHWRCPKCGTVYALGQNVKLIKMTPEQVHNAGDFIKTSNIEQEPL